MEQIKQPLTQHGTAHQRIVGSANPTLEIFVICSPSGLCASLSWSIVSCGKRGSLPVAGLANIVAANQPLAAAIASDDIKMAVFMVSSGAFLQHDPEKWTAVFRKDHAQTKMKRS